MIEPKKKLDGYGKWCCFLELCVSLCGEEGSVSRFFFTLLTHSLTHSHSRLRVAQLCFSVATCHRLLHERLCRLCDFWNENTQKNSFLLKGKYLFVFTLHITNVIISAKIMTVVLMFRSGCHQKKNLKLNLYGTLALPKSSTLFLYFF